MSTANTDDTAPSNEGGNTPQGASQLAKPEYKELARAAVAEQYHSLEYLREAFRRFSQQRRRVFHDPFILDEATVKLLHETVLHDIKKLDAHVPITFIGMLRLKNKREVNFTDCNSLANWSEAEKSHPVRAQLNWRFTYNPPEMNTPLPLKYNIYVDYETEPNFSNKMALDIEEETIVHIEGPSIDWVRSLNEKLEAVVEASRMPIWWRFIRVALVKFKPFFNSGLFFGLSTLVPFFFIFFIGNDNKPEVANAIHAAQDIAKKFDIYIEWWAKPSNLYPFLFYILLAYMAVGVTHLLMSISYMYIAPPSIIALGVAGKNRTNLMKLYSGAWLLVVGAIVGAIFSRFI